MLSGFILRWLILTLCILVVPYLVSGVTVEDFGTALAAAAVLGIFNMVLKPILILFTFPLTILSLGLFILIINAFIFYLAAHFVSGLSVESFGASFFAAIIISIVSWIGNLSVQKQGNRTRVVVVKGNRRIRDVN